MKKNTSKRLLAIALALMTLLSLMPAAFASGDVATDVPETGTVPAAPAAESAPVGEPVPTPEATEPTPTPVVEEPTSTPQAQPTPAADPTPASAPEAATEPTPTAAPEPTPAEEPCTITEGCTLEAGHEGDCITADAAPEGEPDEVAEAVAAFLEAINAIEIPEDLSTLTPEGIEELRAQIDMVLSMPMVLSEPETPSEADDALKKLQEAIEDLKKTQEDINNFLKTHIVYNVNKELWYETLDPAVAEAEDNNTLVLLADCTTAGFNLNKNLRINGNGKTITFNSQGIALWSKALTFTNCNIAMKGIGSTPYAEWNWVSICASNGSCISLYSSSMTLDGAGTSGKHAIYFTGNSMFNLDNSSVAISNYGEDALEWNGGDSVLYAFNLSNSSSFTATNNRSGLAGTFNVTCDASTMDVNNNRGNGSNGSNFGIKNGSVVNFNNNGAHGLSTGVCSITNSQVTANGNGYTGLHAAGEFTATNSTVTVSRNGVTTKKGALYLGTTATVTNSTLTVNSNSGTGIYQKDGRLSIDEASKVEITKNVTDTNKNNTTGLGGGVYINGTANFPAGVKLYNNHASTAGDDIYSTGSITFGATGTDWKLDGMPDCKGAIHDIDGWYDDSENNRWLADTDDTTKQHIVKRAAGINTGLLALKAAHGIIPVTVTVNKVWDDNENSAGKRPDSVTIKLLANGDDTQKSLVLNESNNWRGSFTNLAPKSDGGKDIVYTVKEDTVPYYKSEITSKEDNTFTVTNTYMTKSIQVNKVWNDNNDSNSKRPSSVTIYLYADGKQLSTMYITAKGGWVGTFENHPVYNASGIETKYEIRERNVYGYRNSITATDNGFTVTNTYSPTSYSGTGIPSTGDDSNLALWGIVMAVSLVAGAAAVLITVKKRKDDSK